jgi:chitosanase
VLTPTQKKTAEAIVNIFETSQVRGNYGNVTLIAGDTGHLTFGRSQTTLGSGNLHTVMAQYCGTAGARFAPDLAPYLGRLQTMSVALDTDVHLHNVLRATADDPVMRDTQDAFFDVHYWQPAERAAQRAGIVSPLGVAVVYDSTVHGSWARMRDRTIAAIGSVAAVGEAAWIARYVGERRAWLAGSSRDDLRRTIYRMDAFRRLIDLDGWSLTLPLVVRDLEISLASLAATPRGCYDGPEPGSRRLTVQSPMLRGLDVRLMQLGLSRRGVDIRTDAIFGHGAAGAVRAFQAANGLPATGTVDVDLVVELIGTPARVPKAARPRRAGRHTARARTGRRTRRR